MLRSIFEESGWQAQKELNFHVKLKSYPWFKILIQHSGLWNNPCRLTLTGASISLVHLLSKSCTSLFVSVKAIHDRGPNSYFSPSHDRKLENIYKLKTDRKISKLFQIQVRANLSIDLKLKVNFRNLSSLPFLNPIRRLTGMITMPRIVVFYLQPMSDQRMLIVSFGVLRDLKTLIYLSVSDFLREVPPHVVSSRCEFLAPLSSLESIISASHRN